MDADIDVDMEEGSAEKLPEKASSPEKKKDKEAKGKKRKVEGETLKKSKKAKTVI